MTLMSNVPCNNFKNIELNVYGFQDGAHWLKKIECKIEPVVEDVSSIDLQNELQCLTAFR